MRRQQPTVAAHDAGADAREVQGENRPQRQAEGGGRRAHQRAEQEPERAVGDDGQRRLHRRLTQNRPQLLGGDDRKRLRRADLEDLDDVGEVEEDARSDEGGQRGESEGPERRHADGRRLAERQPHAPDRPQDEVAQRPARQLPRQTLAGETGGDQRDERKALLQTLTVALERGHQRLTEQVALIHLLQVSLGDGPGAHDGEHGDDGRKRKAEQHAAVRPPARELVADDARRREPLGESLGRRGRRRFGDGLGRGGRLLVLRLVPRVLEVDLLERRRLGRQRAQADAPFDDGFRDGLGFAVAQVELDRPTAGHRSFDAEVRQGDEHLLGVVAEQLVAAGAREQQPLRLRLHEQRALAQDADAVAQPGDLVQLVAGQQNRAPLVPRQAVEQAAHLLDALGVEAVGRLVEQHVRGVTEQRLRDAEPLAHAL